MNGCAVFFLNFFLSIHVQFTEVQTTIYRIKRGRKQKRRVIYGVKRKQLTHCFAIQHMILSLQVAFFRSI